jgi:hypothetical protein
MFANSDPFQYFENVESCVLVFNEWIIVSLVEICDFATNEFVTSCDYLTFTTTVGYIYNYCLHLKPLATTLWLTYD